MTDNTLQNKSFRSKSESDTALDFVLEAKDIVRLASEHAQVCESFRKALEDNGIGPNHRTNPQKATHQHRNPTSQLGMNVNASP